MKYINFKVLLKKLSRLIVIGLIVEYFITIWYVYKTKILFIHIPKCAGLSISKSIYGGPIGHKKLSYFKLHLVLFNPYVFTVLRDPEDRFLSALNYAHSGGTSVGHVNYNIHKLVKNNDLELIVNSVANGKIKDPIFLPQSFYLDDSNVKINYYYFNQIDQLETDLSISLIPMNASFLKKFDKNDMLPFNDRIRDLYSEDYKLINEFL